MGPAPQILKGLKSVSIFDEENTDLHGDLLRRSLDHGVIRRGETFRKGCNNFRFAKPGICDAQREVLPQTEESDKVSRAYHKLRIDEHLSTPRESRENNHLLRKTPESRTSKYKRDGEPSRAIDFNLLGAVTWPIALLVTAEATDKKLTGDRVLQNANNLRF